MPQLFHDTVLPERCPVVITGTHGKTTTSTLTAYLLERAGQQPGWLIGGVPKDLPSGARLGAGNAFVIEGDEYDSAFFDKRSKFIHYRPQVAVLNNLEFDHADIFRDLQDVQRSFSHFLRILPASGHALINGDEANLAQLLPVTWTQVVLVGTGAHNDLQIQHFEDRPSGARFELVWKGALWARVEWSLHGLFNARNAAMAALAAAFAAGSVSPLEFDLSALATFSGVARRQDVLYESKRGRFWKILRTIRPRLPERSKPCVQRIRVKRCMPVSNRAVIRQRPRCFRSSSGMRWVLRITFTWERYIGRNACQRNSVWTLLRWLPT